MKEETERPSCSKCGKPMCIISTGERVRTFGCCGETVIVKRKEEESK